MNVIGSRVRKPVPPRVASFVDEVVQLCDRYLGKQLAGVFLIGSLAHGGYSERYSDIDVAVVMEKLSTARDLAVLNEELIGTSPDLAPRLSLFWTDVDFSGGRFPLLDQIDFLDHRVALLQRRPATPERADLRAIRTYLRADPLRNWISAATRFGALSALAAGDHKAYLRALLYPARFIYTWETGLVSSNDDAVAYVQERDRIGSDIDLLLRALSCRALGEDLSELFPERYKLDRLIKICVRISTDVIPPERAK